MTVKRITAIVLAALLAPASLMAAGRALPPGPEVKSLTVRFNGDYLKVLYLYLDARTAEEKAENEKTRKLDGPVLVFFHGHSQRPGDGYNFTKELARRSRSGIVIIPVCDTPFGRDKKLRGDSGKDIILMEVVKYLLRKNNITVSGCTADADMPVIIEPYEKEREGQDMTATELVALGWSHGSLLARRFASRYPVSVKALGQMSPAGFKDWGGYSCTGPGCLLANFTWESMRIGTGIFRGEAGHVFDAGTGIVKGLAGDSFRSCSSCISGNFNAGKPFRPYKDLQECSYYADDGTFPVTGARRIVVIFGGSDSLFQYDKVAGVKDRTHVTAEEEEAFFTKFYPRAVAQGSECRLHVLPGNHIGPLVYDEKWVDALLDGVGEKRPGGGTEQVK